MKNESDQAKGRRLCLANLKLTPAATKNHELPIIATRAKVSTKVHFKKQSDALPTHSG